MELNSKSKLLKIHPKDNILVVRKTIVPGDSEKIGEDEVVFNHSIGIGHKVAAVLIPVGGIIFKYGIPIGSATTTMPAGTHIHLHNMKSDYIATYTLDKEFIHEQQ